MARSLPLLQHPPDRQSRTTLTCTFCSAALPAGSFAFWRGGTLLVCASCPDCRRPRTVGTESWRTQTASAAAMPFA